ncbi:c-Myc-binding protein homolog [Drosophila guanche]|uniref:Blast:C-Myc-binding protein homolog n=1 Tax=Drosophila guanche TaxID=7266 RepID=A0A3B0JEG6_DROGU|nr:c-Myc-binding protein homolog [Drosophila guanche]SPP80495.1 blast:C-Myc-binding protein homolog [Drosophila guanche]
MSFKPIDPKRDEIRRYLERGSVLDSLTKVFIRVIKERPENPMEYIRNNIGAVRHQHDKYERLQEQLQSANEEIERLRGIINTIDPEALAGQASLHSSEVFDESVLQNVATIEAAIENVGPHGGETVLPEPNAVTEEAAGASAGAVAAVSNSVEQLTAAVEVCQIEEKIVAAVAEAANDSSTQSPSVQAEASSTTDNTE